MKCKGGWRVGCCVTRELRRIVKSSDAIQDVREKKVKIQCADNLARCSFSVIFLHL